MRPFTIAFCLSSLLTCSLATAAAQNSSPENNSASTIPADILVRVIRAQDERRWDEELKALFTSADAHLRKRAALAAGRIGDERAVPALIELLEKDSDADVRQMAAFALGQIGSPAGADALIDMLRAVDQSSEDVSLARPTGVPARTARAGWSIGRAQDLKAVRARAIEALGKIAAALPESDHDHQRIYREAILTALKFDAQRQPAPERLTVLLGLTAALRAKPEGAGPIIAGFLSSEDPRIRADAANALARLHLKDGVDKLRALLVKDADPIVRANAARALGAAEDEAAFDPLLNRALHDADLRVRVSAIRALGSLKDSRAAQPLFQRACAMMESLRSNSIALTQMQEGIPPVEQNEWLEIYTTIGNVVGGKPKDAASLKPTPGSPDVAPPQVAAWNRRQLPREVEIALAKIEPDVFVSENAFKKGDEFFADWRRPSSVAQGLGSIATLPLEGNEGKTKSAAQRVLFAMLNDQRLPALALPDALTAYAAFKVNNDAILRKSLGHRDVIVRATAAELLGSESASDETSSALIDALKTELPRTEKGEMNDAALAMLDALAKQRNKDANDAIKTALDSSDHLIRRRAVALLKANSAGDFSNRIGTVKTRNTEADYRRAIARIGKEVRATVETSKGSFTIELMSEEAPLTVDNFVTLARKGFFNGQTIPRVVPNFVIQAGDPRGDMNGGPGYQIRCEVNEVPYERGAVGMALSGKDTGGSQWFVTHSPQPHLDGGYTVFGRVIRGMEVVDNIARGDTIRGVSVNER